MNEVQRGERWLDIGEFGWLVRYEHSDIWMDFHAYQAVGTLGEPGNEKLFERMEANDSSDLVTDPDDAEHVSGHVKWDGCAQVDMGDRHFCGRGDLVDFGRVLIAIHGIAADVLTAFDRREAGDDVQEAG